MIEFRKDQESIRISRNKLTPSVYQNHLDLHLVYDIDLVSGYESKFVRVITFENIYDFELINKIRSDNFEDEFDLKYFENGGYAYDKKAFRI